jgi:hypothetical protein
MLAAALSVLAGQATRKDAGAQPSQDQHIVTDR